MRLILATVVERAADRCHIRVLGESGARKAGYTEPFRARAASVGPGCLVAIDVTTEPPLIAWRWFPATVLAVRAEQVRLDEPFHGVIEAAHVAPAPAIGELVYVTNGLSAGWRIDATADDPNRAESVLREIEELYLRQGWVQPG